MYGPQIQSEGEWMNLKGDFAFFMPPTVGSGKSSRPTPFESLKLNTEHIPIAYHIPLRTVRAGLTGVHGSCGYLYPKLPSRCRR